MKMLNETKRDALFKTSKMGILKYYIKYFWFSIKLRNRQNLTGLDKCFNFGVM